MVVKKIINQKGQAIFELIFFLPIFVILIPFFVSIGNSLNMSINQQKVSRRYFYYLYKGDSKLPTRKDLDNSGGWGQQKLSNVSLAYVAWADRSVDRERFGACSSLTKFLKPIESEDCDSRNSDAADDKTGFIRVYTAYGVCGTSYSYDDANSIYTSSLNQNNTSIASCAATP